MVSCTDLFFRILVFSLLTYPPQYMTEAKFNWKMLKNIFTELHVYDKEKNYIPFDFDQKEEKPLFAAQRKFF